MLVTHPRSGIELPPWDARQIFPRPVSTTLSLVGPIAHSRSTMTDEKTAAAADAATPPPPAKEPAAKPGATNAPAVGNSKGLWMGTAVGIGSAAIVAALLYTRRQK